jgi:hypothetical protein
MVAIETANLGRTARPRSLTSMINFRAYQSHSSGKSKFLKEKRFYINILR